MAVFSSKDELMRIEDMIRRGRSNQDIITHMNAVYSDAFLDAFRDYLKEKDKRPMVLGGIAAADLVLGVEAKTRAQMEKDFEDRQRREANNTAARHGLSINAMKITSMRAEGLTSYNILADKVYIGVGSSAQCIRLGDMERFIEDLRYARDLAQGMVKDKYTE